MCFLHGQRKRKSFAGGEDGRGVKVGQALLGDEGLAPIRKRPGIYVGELNDLLLPNKLLLETLCVAFKQATQWEVTELQISVWPGGRAHVYDNGPGWGLQKDRRGKIPAEQHVGVLYACKEAKDCETSSFCEMGIGVTNALSSEFELQTWEHVVPSTNPDSVALFGSQTFREGQPDGPFEVAEVSRLIAGRGTTIYFELDRSILPLVEFNVPALLDSLKNLRPGKLSVTVLEWADDDLKVVHAIRD